MEEEALLAEKKKRCLKSGQGRNLAVMNGRRASERASLPISARAADLDIDASEKHSPFRCGLAAASAVVFAKPEGDGKKAEGVRSLNCGRLAILQKREENALSLCLHPSFR